MQRWVLLTRQDGGSLESPDLKIAEQPWIPEREWALCPWVPRHVRGAFVNPHADNRMDLFRYSDRQLGDYVAMFDWFGYSGVQLLETSYSYGVMGSPEAFQDRQRAIAKFAKGNGQKVSLWVWAARFEGFGWFDPAVVYRPQSGSAFDDPNVRRTFEKYYDHYARLAPDVDRLIGHFYDPGQLRNRDDVFRYMRLLERKFRAVNPQVKMAIDTWGTGHDYLRALMENGFQDYLLLEKTMPHMFKPGEREQLHSEAKRLGIRLGVWGWYTAEYETDQLASLYVNARMLQRVYRQIRDGAAKIQPIDYWSEMEAHHLNNIYSMYAAAQLLWNPDRDPDQILGELTEAIWGVRNGPKVLEALKLIQDVRTGEAWETYWWTLPEFRLGTAGPAQDLSRAEAALAALRALTDDGTVPKIPLPFPPPTFIELMLPHLEQIRAFAAFRVELESIRAAMAGGLAGDELGRRLSAAWKPIPELTTWIGTFGQPEARRQETLLRGLADQAKVTLVEPGWVRARDADRLLQKIRNMQRERKDEFRFRTVDIREFFWPRPKLQDRLDKLLSEGSIEKLAPDSYRLANWEDLVWPR
jgi:hypothetical protein